MRHRLADDAVDGGGIAERTELVVVHERGRVDLADLLQRAGIGPGRSEAAGEHARDETIRPHADHDHAALPLALRAEIQQRHRVAQRAQGRRDLDHLGAGLPHRVHARRQVDRDAVKVVRRQDDAPSLSLRDQIVEPRTPFQVDVIGAERQRVGEDPPAFVFRSGERTAFPVRPAGHDHRTPPPRQRAGGRRIANRVEPQLDQVGVDDRVAPLGATRPSWRP